MSFGKKTSFVNKYLKSKCIPILIQKIIYFQWLKKILSITALYIKDLKLLGVECYFYIVIHFRKLFLKNKIIIKRITKYFFTCSWLKMMFSSLFAMLTLSKTTSPKKLFRSGCMTLKGFYDESHLTLLDLSIEWWRNCGDTLTLGTFLHGMVG